MVYARSMGARVKRKEDPRLITGRSTYVDDIQPHGLAYVAILRGVYAHATITAIDTSAAAAHPGVIAVYSGTAFRDMVEPMPHGGEGAVPPDMKPIATPVLAHGRVRYVGEPIAVVVAGDRYVARDALDLIEVDYEPLEAAVDLEAAVAPDAPQLYDDVPGNVAYTWTCKQGDPDGAFAAADVTVRQRLVNQRLAGVAMEPRGVLTQPDALSGGLVVITSTQNPHTVRREIAATLRLPEISVRVIAPCAAPTCRPTNAPRANTPSPSLCAASRRACATRGRRQASGVRRQALSWPGCATSRQVLLRHILTPDA